MTKLQRIQTLRPLLAAITLCIAMHANGYSTQVSIKSKYLGSIGTTVDDQAVIQPYVEFGGRSGFYGYFWANLPLTEGNPRKSAELEPSIGYRQATPWFNWDAALTVFDLQAPKLLQYRQDVLSPSITLSKNNIHLQLRYYGADRADDGTLLKAGYRFPNFKGISMNTSLVYVDAPFQFEPIAYTKTTISTNFNESVWALSLELMDIFYFENTHDTRQDEFALALSYRF